LWVEACQPCLKQSIIIGISNVTVKITAFPFRAVKAYRKSRSAATYILTSALYEVSGLLSRPGRFTARKIKTVPIKVDAGYAPRARLDVLEKTKCPSTPGYEPRIVEALAK
jgi:hypothetical protein